MYCEFIVEKKINDELVFDWLEFVVNKLFNRGKLMIDKRFGRIYWFLLYIL